MLSGKQSGTGICHVENIQKQQTHRRYINPLESRVNYSAASNNMKLVHCPLIGGLLHLVERQEDWAGPHPAQAPPRITYFQLCKVRSFYVIDCTT